MFYIKEFLENFAKFTGKNLCQSLFFNKVAGLQLYQKRGSDTVVSCEFCKISKKTSYRTPPVAASASNTVIYVQAVKLASLLKRDPRTGLSEPAVRRSSTK